MEEAHAYLTIDLGKIAENYELIKKRLKSGTTCSAVVKADSYGLGSRQIVKKLYDDKACRCFYVSYLSEALPEIAPDADFFILHGLAGVADADFTTHTIPVLNSIEDIQRWSAFANKQGRKLDCSIHIDTGMNRLGLTSSDIANKGDELRSLAEKLNVRYVMSHLACADESAHPKNAEQLQKMKEGYKALGINAKISFAASSGIFLGEDYHFDQVRPGAALYGINPEPGKANPLNAVAELKVRILQTHIANSGETVGYSATYSVPKNMKLATIATGYADGMFRALSNHNGAVYIGGEKCPIIGRVSMDAIIVDMTGIEGDHQWAEVIGPHQTVDELAAQAKTIGYEIFTALGGRYKRVYK